MIVLGACAQTPHALSEKAIITFAQRHHVTVLASANIDNDYTILLVSDVTANKCIKLEGVGTNPSVDELITTNSQEERTERVRFYSIGEFGEEGKQTSGMCFAIIDPFLQQETDAIILTTETQQEIHMMPTDSHMYLQTWPIETNGYGRFATITLLDRRGDVLFKHKPFQGRTNLVFPSISSTPTPLP